MNESILSGVPDSTVAQVDSATSAAKLIDCLNLALGDLASRDTLDEGAHPLDQATQTLWDRCCHGAWSNNGVVAAYADGGDAEGGQARVAPDLAHEQLVLGYAPLDPGAGDGVCGGELVDAAGSKSLVGFAQSDRPGGGSSFSISSGGVGGDGLTIAGGGGSFGGGGGAPAARQPSGWAPGVTALPAQGGAPVRVPEIDAMGGVVALAMLAALVAFRRERR